MNTQLYSLAGTLLPDVIATLAPSSLLASRGGQSGINEDLEKRDDVNGVGCNLEDDSREILESHEDIDGWVSFPMPRGE